MRQFVHVTRPRGTFPRFARWAAHAAGHSGAFGLAVLIIVTWAATGPVFGFSDTWQLAINTGTTIVTFLMVFLIQNTQTRDTIALQLKIDELIRVFEGAHTVLLDLEELTEDELEEIRKRYIELARKAREELRKGHRDTGRPRL